MSTNELDGEDEKEKKKKNKEKQFLHSCHDMNYLRREKDYTPLQTTNDVFCLIIPSIKILIKLK